MYSKELEAIIEAALADGVLTDKEREVLHRRAAQEGVDADELDVIIEGKLAKMKQEKDWLRPDPPTNEKRGNVVKCPNCGAPIQAGDVKCAECGYVFTNVQANSSMERLQQGIADITKRYDTRIDNASDEEKNFLSTSEKQKLKYTMHDEIENYIMHFPIPSSKEDLIEFTAAMNGNRRQVGYYEDAYRAKYKECIVKIKTLFSDDPQMMDLVKQTDTKWGRLSSDAKYPLSIIGGITLIFLIVGISSLFEKTETNDSPTNIDPNIAIKAEAQCDSLCALLDNLEMPDINNYKQVENQLLRITWKNIPGDETDYKKSYLEKKRNIAKQIGSVVVAPDGDCQTYEENGAPDFICDPDWNISN